MSVVGLLAGSAVMFLVFTWALSGLAMRRARATVGQAPPAAAGDHGRRAPALFYFYSPTCGPCRAMAPIVDQLAAEGRDVRKVDVTREPEVAAAFSVLATPTSVVVRDGTVAEVLLGVVARPRLEALLA